MIIQILFGTILSQSLVDVEYLKRIVPTIEAQRLQEVVWAVEVNSITHGLEKKLLYNIIEVESNFNYKAVSSTGDHGIMQINKNTIKDRNLNKQLIKNDIMYSVYNASTILKELKVKYGVEDSIWWARYHSATKKYKINYVNRIKKVRNKYDSYIKSKEVRP